MGGWRKRDVVEFHCSLNFYNKIDSERLSDVIAKGLVFALSSAQPHLWPRHRWLGADLAVEEVGRLECVHGLLSATFPLFCERASGKTKPTRFPPGAAPPSALPPAGQPLLPLQDSPEDEVAVLGGGGTQPASVEPMGTASAISGPASKAAENDMHRKKALQWLRVSPLGALMLIRQTMEPLVQIIVSQLKLGSADWEISERANIANIILMGGRSIRPEIK